MSKRHKVVHVHITYQNHNNRVAISNEINLLNELNTVMKALGGGLHNHGKDDVTPNVFQMDGIMYTASIDLQFPIYSKRVNDDCGVRGYPYYVLYATLELLAKICNSHEANFLQFGFRLDLSGMRSPWVLPVGTRGAILRDGFKQSTYNNIAKPAVASMRGEYSLDVDQMIVVGEPRAVEEFDRVWGHVVDQYSGDLSGLELDVVGMQLAWPKIQWQHLGIFVKTAGDEGFEWNLLDSRYNHSSRAYILKHGNDMLTRPIGYLEGTVRNESCVFLKDCSYYEFQ